MTDVLTAAKPGERCATGQHCEAPEMCEELGRCTRRRKVPAPTPTTFMEWWTNYKPSTDPAEVALHAWSAAILAVKTPCDERPVAWLDEHARAKLAEGRPAVVFPKRELGDEQPLYLAAPSAPKEQAQSDGWVPVSERLPEGPVLLLTTSKAHIIGDWYQGAWRTHRSRWEEREGKLILVSAFRPDDITHWMPLPAAPSKGERE